MSAFSFIFESFSLLFIVALIKFVDCSESLLVDNETDFVASEQRLRVEQNLAEQARLAPETDDDWYRRTLDWCDDTLRWIMHEDYHYLNILDQEMADLYFVDHDEAIRIDGDLTFEAIVSVVDSLIINASLLTNTNPAMEILTEYSFQSLKDAEKQLQTFTRQEDHLNKILEKGLRINGDQVINGSWTLDFAHFSCGCTNCSVESLVARNMNGRTVADLHSNLIPLDKDLIISSSNFMFDSISVRSHLHASSINGLNPSRIVTKSGSFDLESEFIEPDLTVKVDSLSVGRNINGLRIDGQTMLTKSGDQFYDGHIDFARSVSVVNLSANCYYRQINSTLNHLLSGIVSQDRPAKIRAPKYFKSLNIKQNLQLNTGPSLYKVDMDHLQRNLLTKTTPQLIHAANVTIDTLIAEGSLQVNSLNGIGFRPENFVQRNGKQDSVVSAPKIFLNNVAADTVKVERSLNGRPVRNGSLDLLLKNQDQTIYGRKTFPKIILQSDSQISGSIGGLDMKYWMRNEIYGGKLVEIEGPITINNLVVTGLVNGINVSNLYTDFLRVDQQLISQDLFMSQAHFRAPISCAHVNSIPFSKHFITKKGNQFVESFVTFGQGLTTTGPLSVDLFNNQSVSALISDSLRTTQDQTIKGSKRIQNLYVRNLVVKKLNFHKMSDAILLHTNQTLLGRVKFSNLRVDRSLHSYHINGLKYINKVSMKDLMFNSLRHRYPQKISTPVITHKLTIPENSNVDVDSIDGYQLAEILNSAIYINSTRPQHVFGNKHFESSVVFGNLNVKQHT